MTFTYFELFSGILGFTLGFERSGMKCVGYSEIDPYAIQVCKQQRPNTPNYGDIRNVTKENVGNVDLICGGFPCQDVSLAGARAGLDGERSGLWGEFSRIIAECRPRWIIIENVPGLLSSNGGRDMATILTALAEFGYGWAYRVLDAQYFGVAQRRRRVFIVASLGDHAATRVLFDEASASGSPAEAGIKEREDYPGDESGFAFGYWWNGNPISQTLDAVLYKKQAMPEKNRFPVVSVPLWQRCQMCEDYWCNLHHMHAYDCDCPSIDEMDIFPYDPVLWRYLTPLECERLQGFPDNWTAGLSNTRRYKALGNAVAVNVIEWIGRRIIEVNNEK